MPKQPELALAAPTPPTKAAPRVIWHFATNHLNLMFHLAAGLITGPRGLGAKYYRDPLSVAPGWIPLFDESIPAGAMAQATSEENYLQGVAAAVDLSKLTGAIQAFNQQAKLVSLLWPSEATGSEQVLFVPAPLPSDWIQAILFPSAEARMILRQQSADYANASVDAYKQKVQAKLFSTRDYSAWPPWPPESVPLPERDQGVHRVSAVGGFQALLLALGNRGEVLVECGACLAEPMDVNADQPEDPLLRALLRWVHGQEAPPEEDEVQSALVSRVLAAILNAKASADSPTGADDGQDLHQAVLDALDAEKSRLAEPRLQEALDRLIADLRGLLGLGDATLSELLKRHQRPPSRALLLYFLREKSTELLDIAHQQSLLTDQDLVVAAALFAAREGWLGLPNPLKETPGLAAAVTHRMAALAHHTHNSGIDLGAAPARVKPLRELWQPRDGVWNKRQHESALHLARTMGWQELLKTRISLGKGDYRLHIDGRGAHLVLDGDVKAVTTEVDQTQLFARLVSVSLPRKIEAEVRTLLINRPLA
jgi:hypothetical protein